jgi:LPXTG-motif cell wall-anchored protein
MASFDYDLGVLGGGAAGLPMILVMSGLFMLRRRKQKAI